MSVQNSPAFESARRPLKRQRPIVFSLVTFVLAFAWPGSAQQLQRPVSGAAVGIVGTFEAVQLDDFQNKRSAYIYSVKDRATNRRFELHLSTPPDTSMLTGDLVSVEGTLVGSTIEDAGVTAYSGDTTLFPRDASPFSTLAKGPSPTLTT